MGHQDLIVTEAHRSLAAKITNAVWMTTTPAMEASVAHYIAEHDAANPCPKVVNCSEGTQYCALAEETVAKLTARCDTRLNAIVALMAACEEVDAVLVHVAARPHVRHRLLAVMQQVRNGEIGQASSSTVEAYRQKLVTANLKMLALMQERDNSDTKVRELHSALERMLSFKPIPPTDCHHITEDYAYTLSHAYSTLEENKP